MHLLRKYMFHYWVVVIIAYWAYAWYTGDGDTTDHTLTEYQHDQQIFDAEKQEATDRAVELDKTLSAGRLEKLAQQRPDMVRRIVSRASDDVFLRLACPSVSATMLSSISTHRDEYSSIGSGSMGNCPDY